VSTSSPKSHPATASQAVTLDDERALEVTPEPGGALLRLRSSRPGEALELEIRFEPSGPVVRVKAAELEITASRRIVARCDEFAVEARESIRLESAGTISQRAAGEAAIAAGNLAVDTSPGAIRLHANDDVQLLGELILLNCDRTPPMPAWIPPGRGQIAALPPALATGDAEVLAEMRGEEP